MGARADLDELFDAEFTRLVRALGVAFTPESAADAVQEAFLVADRKWVRVSRLSDPAAWVRRVALNRLLNERRNVIQRAEILATIRPVPTEELTADRLDLRQAVDGLPQRMRLTVCLHYLADLPVDEVAALLGVSAGTVKSNLFDARQKLRQQLEERTWTRRNSPLSSTNWPPKSISKHPGTCSTSEAGDTALGDGSWPPSRPY